jgi:oligoendopeptidase F
MTKEEYLAMESGRYEEIESLKAKDNFYDYEKSFDQIWQDLGRLYLENHMNEQSSTRDQRKKNAYQIRRNKHQQISPIYAGVS